MIKERIINNIKNPLFWIKDIALAITSLGTYFLSHEIFHVFQFWSMGIPVQYVGLCTTKDMGLSFLPPKWFCVVPTKLVAVSEEHAFIFGLLVASLVYIIGYWRLFR